jgi:hypothetical protein
MPLIVQVTLYVPSVGADVEPRARLGLQTAFAVRSQ